MIGKRLRRNNPTNILYIKEKEICLYLKILFELWETNNYINDSKRRKRRIALPCSKKLPTLLREITSKHQIIFIA